MEELVRTIASSLVDDPSQVEVTSDETDEEIVIELHVAESDMGKVIGKQGRIAKALRTVVKAMAVRDNKRVTVNIVA